MRLKSKQDMGEVWPEREGGRTYWGGGWDKARTVLYE